jgi:HEAT repeat protein
MSNDDEALDSRGRNITLGVFGGIVLLIAGLVFNNYRIKQDRIAGMKSDNHAVQAAKAREMMQGWSNPGHIAEQLQGERPSVRLAAVRALKALSAQQGPREKTTKDAARLTVPFLKDTDQPIKDAAIQSLTAMGPDIAMDAATEALGDTDAAVKAGAQAVCQNFGGISIPSILAFTGKNGADSRLRKPHRTSAGIALHEISKKKNQAWNTVMLFGEEAVHARERKLTPQQSHEELRQFMGLHEPLVLKPEDRVYGLVDYLKPENATEEDQNNAISILDRVGDQRAVPDLIPKIAPPATRRAAVGALGRLGDRRATPYLVQRLPVDETNRLELVIALGRIADPAAVAPLIEHGLGSVSQPVRLAAADALRNIGAPAMPQLIAAARKQDAADPAYYKAEGAVRALAGLRIPAATQVAVAALKHPSANVREAAAASLGDSGDPAVIGPLVESFGDAEGRVAGFAARSLAQPGAKAVPQLVKALSDPKRVYWAALVIRSYVGQPAVPALKQKVLDGDPHGARAAATLLGELGDDGAIPALRQAMAKRTDPEFRFAAENSIERLSGPGSRVPGRGSESRVPGRDLRGSEQPRKREVKRTRTGRDRMKGLERSDA